MSFENENKSNSFEHFDQDSEAFRSRLETLNEEMYQQSISPFGGDQYIGAFFKDALDLKNSSKDFDDIINNYMAERTEITHGPYAALLLFRTIHHHARMNDDAYPNESYLTEGTWKNKINELLENPENRNEIILDLETKTLQSNKESRAWGLLIPLYSLISNGRFERPPRILEVGTGRMHLLKMIIMGGWIPGLEYENVSVLDEQNRIDLNSTIAVNKLSEKQLSIGESLGIDIVPIAETEHMERVYSDSFSPKELIGLKFPVRNLKERFPDEVFAARRREDNYRLLDYATPPQLSFMELDFLNSAQAELLKPWDFDVIFFSSIMYQHSEEQRDQDINRAKEIVGSNGLIVIQDDVEVADDNPAKSHFYESWSKDWQYNTLAVDMRNPSEIQTLIEWETNLCKTMRFGLGRLAVGDTLKTLPELLRIAPF